MRLRSLFLFSCVALVACAGILGLEEPSFLGDGPSGSEGGTGDATTEGSSGGGDACFPNCGPLVTTKLASDLGTVFDIAIDEDSVYFTSFDRWLLGRVRKDGTGRVDLLPEGGVQEPTGLRLQGDRVYWTAYGAGDFADFRNGVRRMPKAGGLAESIEKCNTALDVVVDAKYVYAVSFVCGGTPRVRKFVKEDRDAGFVDSFIDVNSETEYGYAMYGWAAEDNEAVYWSSAKIVRRLEKGFAPDAAPSIVGQSPGGAIQAIAVADRLYVLMEDTLLAFDKSGLAKPVTLAEGLATAGGRASIALDEKWVYFTEAKAGLVSRVPRDGAKQQVEVIEKGQALPSGIAIDAVWVYWANAGDGTIWRTPKPK